MRPKGCSAQLGASWKKLMLDMNIYIYIIIYSISKIELGIAHVLQTRLRMANDMPENKKLEISATSIKSSK